MVSQKRVAQRLRFLPLFVGALSSGFAFLSLATPASAKVDFKFGGRVNMEYRIKPGYRESDFPKDFVAQIETKRKEGFQVGVDVRATDESARLALREVYIDYKSEPWRLIAGRNKKRFGLDWDYSLEDILPLSRPLMHRKFASLGYTGRDTMIELRAGDNDEPGANHSVSLHTSEGINGSALYRYWLNRGERQSWISYTLFQMENISGQRIPAGAQALAFRDHLGDLRFETQLSVGVDAFATEYERSSGSGRTVFFTGAQAGAEWRGWKFRPYLMLSALFDDVTRTTRNDLELSAGARYYFLERLSLGLQGRWIRAQAEAITAYERESLVMTALRYFF